MPDRVPISRLMQNLRRESILPGAQNEEGKVSDTPVMVALGEDYPELREAVAKICERYPGAYWRKLEAEQAYPTEFITELTVTVPAPVRRPLLRFRTVGDTGPVPLKLAVPPETVTLFSVRAQFPVTFTAPPKTVTTLLVQM